MTMFLRPAWWALLMLGSLWVPALVGEALASDWLAQVTYLVFLKPM